MNPIKLNQPADVDAVRRQQRAETQTAAEARRTSPAEVSTRSERHDTLRVSDRAAIVNRLVEQTKALPDVRRERVEALRNQIAQGEYNPPAADIAAAILREAD